METEVSLGRSSEAGKFWRRLWWVAAFAVVFLMAAGVRLYGVDWDDGTHLHPDERYLTMVVSAIHFPGEVVAPGDAPACQGLSSCLSLVWDTASSPLNPANYEGYATYVYGTLPLFMTRAVGHWLDTTLQQSWCTHPGPLAALALGPLLRQGNEVCVAGYFTGYSGIYLVGRVLSALMDLVTLAGLIWLGSTLYDRRTALLAGALYAFAVLPVQHAHFFVVDSFATIFVVWTLLFCALSVRHGRLWLMLPAGLTTGLAVASKISVWPMAAVVAVAAVLHTLRRWP